MQDRCLRGNAARTGTCSRKRERLVAMAVLRGLFNMGAGSTSSVQLKLAVAPVMWNNIDH